MKTLKAKTLSVRELKIEEDILRFLFLEEGTLNHIKNLALQKRQGLNNFLRIF